MNRSVLTTCSIALACLFFLQGCSVGAKVHINASNVEYPVSQTNSFYTPNNQLIITDEYEILEEFSFTFTKWGVSSLINIQSEEDISNQLNRLIKEHNGDAIVDLTIAVYNPPFRNGILWFTKTVALSAALITFPIAIIEAKAGYAVTGAGSAAVFLFTPAAADIKVEGKVVRLLE